MILVVGQPRSGTTAVARMLHHLGCPMGLAMAMPMPAPGTDYDFEDIFFLSDVKYKPISEVWPRYEAARADQRKNFIAAGLPVADEWGVKTAHLYNHLDEIKRVSTETVKVVECKRPKWEREESARVQFRHVEDAMTREKMLAEMNSFEGLSCPSADLTVEYESLQSESVAHELARLCGSKNDPSLVYLNVSRHWSK